MSPWLILPAVYVIGYLVMWFFLARNWMQDFGTSVREAVNGGAWGMLGALAWPLLIPIYAMGMLARRFS